MRFQHDFPFDPTGGMSPQQLHDIRPPEEASGFEPFWQARYDRARQLDPQPVLTGSTVSHPDWQVFDIAYRSTGNVTIHGWLLLPRDGVVRRGLVMGHGYGGREAPDFDLPVEETAILFPCFRGLSKSALPGLKPEPAWHVLRGIGSAKDYIIGGCVEDLWLAVSTLLSLHPQIAGRIAYSGISFGGGIGALATPFDARISRLFLEVPTFGHRPLWQSLPTTGSASAVQAYLRNHPDAAETLRLFDAAVAATKISVPTLVAAALFDPAVAPPCQFAIANAAPRFNEIFTLDAGHFDYHDGAVQQDTLRERLRQFLRHHEP